MTSTDPLDAEQLAAYFALMEVSTLLRHAVEQQLRADGPLSYVQFDVLARLSESDGGSARMTELADGSVYSRSGLTYQAEQLEKAGLITRGRADDDERGITAAITPAGRALLAQVLPGHRQVVRELLLDHLSGRESSQLARTLGQVRDRLRRAAPRSATSRSATSRSAGRSRRGSTG